MIESNECSTRSKGSRRTMEIEWANQKFVLHADRALLWPTTRTVVVADLHIGKDSLFQARGLPLPGGSLAKDLLRLTSLIEEIDARRLLILGDMFHGKESQDASTLRQLLEWRDGLPGVEIILARGNHDHHAGDPHPDLQIQTVSAVREGRVVFSHLPDEIDGMFVMCGHVHPACRLDDFDGSGVGVPCFVVDERQMILPAFGRLTGTARIAHRPGRQLFVAARGRVLRA